jgi:CRP-like cAMP-binding protein
VTIFGEVQALWPSSTLSLFSATTECTLATLKHDLFNQLLSTRENFNRQIMYRLAERLQKQMTRIHEYST